MGRRKKRKTKIKPWYLKKWGLLLSVSLLCVSLNFLYQIYKKPGEIFAFIVPGNYKSTAGTWKHFKDDFRENETDLVPAELLAALVQVESSGNPTARPPWVWKWTTDLSQIYSPASSSIGLLQITNGTFKEGKRYCIYKGQLVKAGKWYEFNKCFGNWLYTRFWPSHSIELTASILHKYLNRIEKRLGKKLNYWQKIKLGSVIHLCGKNKAIRLAKNNFRMSSLGSCGSHSPVAYVNKVFKTVKKIKTIN